MNINLQFRSGDLTLSGTLSLPAGDDGPWPTALLISGSGPVDRDSNHKKMKLNVMGDIAEYLAQAGIASFRYDKRGVGESEGAFMSAGYFDNVSDAGSALEALRERAEVADLFVVGHSEGALIASELAARGEQVAGIVLLSGAAQTGESILKWQAAQVAPTLPAWVRGLMKLLRQDLVKSQAKKLQKLRESTGDTMRMQMIKINAKWFREFLDYDPAAALSRVRVPTLAVTGGKDIQVDPDDIALMEKSGVTDFTGHVLDNVTHLLRTEDGPASIRTYKKQIKQPIDPHLLNLVSGWILEHSAQAPQVAA